MENSYTCKTTALCRRFDKFFRINLFLVFLIQSQFCLGENELSEPDFDGVSLPSKRTDVRGIKRVKESIARGEYTQAMHFLDEILGRLEDSFVLVDKSAKHVGLKKAALELVQKLPKEGRLVYETNYEPVAKRLLVDALARGDMPALRSISRRYFHTPSGLEATMLTAKAESDLGRYLSAALTYEQMLRIPAAVDRLEPLLSVQTALCWLALDERERAETLLNQLNDMKTQLQIRGKRFDLPSDTAALFDELVLSVGGKNGRNLDPVDDGWFTFHGNPQRNLQPKGGLPHLRVDWNVRLLGHPALKMAYEELFLSRKESRNSLVPVGLPLAVGDYLITRSAHNLIAVDFKTGKRVWQAQSQRFSPFDKLINGITDQENQAGLEPAQAFAQRIWDDSLFSTLSSDGERVFAIRDLEPANSGRYHIEAQFLGLASDEINLAATNRLCAYDLATQGKLVWEIDGASESSALSGSFFLGAPLVVGKSLYSLVEKFSEKAVYLVCIDPSNGSVLWQQQLVNLESGILSDVYRRLQSSSPSFSEGIMVCPTAAGVAIGVDLVQNSLAWAYLYKADRNHLRYQGRRGYRNNSTKGRWVDSSARIVNNRVLLTPTESDSIHVLDLSTGELIWKRECRNGLFIAGIHDGVVLVVCQNGLRGLELRDGANAWSQLIVPFSKDASPSGQGFLSEGKYYLPLTSAEIIVVDVKNGKIIDRAISREGKSLGNLLCYRGTVVSQDGSSLERFGQMEVLKRQSLEQLESDPTNHIALRTLGEMSQHSGNLAEAIDLLRESNKIAPEDLQTRDVLSECLREALDQDFGRYRKHIELLEEIQTPTDKRQLVLLRLKSKGLLEVGEILESFSVCEQMIIQGSRTYSLLHIGRNRQVTLPRWIRAQVLAIWNQATAEQREVIESKVHDQITAVLQSGNRLEREWLNDCYGTLPICEALALEEGIHELQEGNFLSAQQILLKLCDSNQNQIAAQAVAHSSKLLHDLGLHNPAAEFDQRLGTEFADIECIEGMLGSEYLEQWSREGLGALSWPSGTLTVSPFPASRSTERRSSRPLNVEVPLDRCDSVLANCNILLGHTSRELLIRDSQGHEFFRMPLGKLSTIPLYDMGRSYGVSRGNLLVVSSGYQFLAVDTLNSRGAGLAKPLWKRQSFSNFDKSMVRMRGRSIRQIGARPGTHRAPRVENEGKWIGVIGPLTHNSCVIQNQARLVCLDPLTGELLWMRTDLPAGCDLFGDDEFTFVVERNSMSASVFSTIDGRSLGQVESAIVESKAYHVGAECNFLETGSESK